MIDELTHLHEVLEDVDVKRAHSSRRAQQPTPPHTLSTAPSLHPHPTSPLRFISGGSPSHPHARKTPTPETGGPPNSGVFPGPAAWAGRLGVGNRTKGMTWCPLPRRRVLRVPLQPRRSAARGTTRSSACTLTIT